MRRCILGFAFAAGVACSPAAQAPAAFQQGPEYGGTLRYRTNPLGLAYIPFVLPGLRLAAQP